jgi:hypothetical protein
MAMGRGGAASLAPWRTTVEAGHLGVRGSLRIPTKPAMHSNTKPAMHSNTKPAAHSDLKPASVPI